MERLGRFAGGRVRIGVSPHAPYTVSGPLYAATAAWAREAGLPIAVHLAESPAESALLASGTGAFADAWRNRGIPMPAPLGRSPVAWLDEHGVLSERTLCIHVVQAGPADVQRLARANAAVAHCPLSNRAHGHGDGAARGAAAAGLRVGLGTDSDHERGDPRPAGGGSRGARAGGARCRAALALCTRDAARALGLEREIGSPGAGQVGRLRRHPASRGADGRGASAEERVLASGPRDVLATFLGGRDVYRSQPTAMKIQRHAAILRVVRERRIESQDDLREALSTEGFVVTQATLSRDIRELGLAKLADPQGGAFYTHPHRAAVRPDLAQVLPALLVSVDGVGPLLVLKTASGSPGR